MYIYIYGSRLKLPVASPSCRFPIHKIDTLQLIPRILGRVSYLPHPVKGNDIFADCCGILSWLRMEIMGRGGDSVERKASSIRRFGNNNSLAATRVRRTYLDRRARRFLPRIFLVPALSKEARYRARIGIPSGPNSTS